SPGEAVKAAAPFTSTAVAQNDTTAVAAAFPAHAPAPTPFAACNNPDALGLSRVIEIDTAGGPAFGTEHFKQYDFLRDKEVALTFDDGPVAWKHADGAQGPTGQLHQGDVRRDRQTRDLATRCGRT